MDAPRRVVAPEIGGSAASGTPQVDHARKRKLLRPDEFEIGWVVE
jgi:hypothetical protein